ncbi:MAG: hypothetical protein Fur0010_20600 [Bdellovibrio sp.]
MRWLFRRECFSHFDDINIKHELVVSPVNGIVIDTKENVKHKIFGENLREVRLMIPWHHEYGIYLPETSEVEDIKVEKGPALFRLSNQKISDQIDKVLPGVCVTLKNLFSDRLFIQFIKCTMGYWPELKVMSGDRGRASANIGYFPFGGTVLLYLPMNYEIMVTEQQEVEAGKTPIAGRKG